MMRLAMSSAASALLRILVARSQTAREHILLTDVQSTEWRSLTFNGERHHLALRIAGPGAMEAATRISEGLGDAEFSIPSIVVADIAMVGAAKRESDGSVALLIEALTIAND